MANDGQIVFEVTADGRKAISDIKGITAAIEKESKNWDKAADQSTANINDSFSGLLKKLVAGFSAVKIGKALLDIGKDAVEAASALEEVQNVVDVTFGNNAGTIDRWAKNASSQFGLTETQAKKFASTLGAMMKSSGMAGDEIVGMSTDLAGLAADMASFYNLDFDTAFQKIRSGISGETEPLKQLGINMSTANLEAFALSQGLEKTWNQMSQGEQTMLRYQYLMQATSDAQGDFARTSDGYANSLRQLETNIDRIKTALGTSFIDAVGGAVGELNKFLELLIPKDESTVIDDFNNIDIDTEGKLAQISEVATSARELVEQLEKINGKAGTEAGASVQKLASDLGNINFDQGKAGIVKEFVKTLGDNIGIISAITGENAQGVEDWLSRIATAADELDPNDAEGWDALLTSIKEFLPGIENTDFGQSFFQALSEGYKDLAGETSVLDWALDTLGNKTNRTAEEQALWLEICKRLVQTIPGLSSIINTETGEIKGGTQAVKDYIDAWEKGQEKLALLGALEQKETALSSRFADLPGLQLDAALAEKRVRDQKKKLDEIRKKYGLDGEGYEMIIRTNATGGQGILSAQEQEWNDAIVTLGQLRHAAQEANDEYERQKDALEEAKQALIEYREAIEEEYGSIEAAKEAGVEWSDEMKENAKTLVNAAKESLSSLADYAQSVRDSVEKSVDGVVSGFNKIVRPTTELEKQRDKLIQQQQELDKGAKDYQNKYNEIENKIREINKELDQYKPKGMQEALESQMAFMNQYIDNLQKAQAMGLSNDLLASLSDGSTESAEYLAALVADPEAAKKIDETFREVQKKKQEFTDALTEQQLTVDQVYQSMAAEAKAAVEALDLESEAKDNAGKTVAGLAQGIAGHVPDVQSAVDSIIAQLNRLSSWGISIDLGSFGTIPLSSDATITPLAVGMDYVPFDGFLASLHEGESVLTAEEARIWRQFKDGGVDYDAMGGVMRDNIKPGGNVYLDGRVVGSVISDQQGKSYRQLQRSGWQQ